MKFKKFYLWLLVLVLLTPLGLIAGGSGWGEKPLKTIYSGFMSGYNLPGFSGSLLSAIGYIISAIVGVTAIFLIFKLIGHFWPDEPKKQGGN